MEKARAELGSLCLVSTTTDLELQLNSSAQFAANDPKFTIEELIRKALDVHSTGKPWVTLGDTFKLIVSLLLDGVDVEPQIMMQAFSHNLYNSEMWCQLRLEPTSMTLSNDRTVTIQLSHSTDDAHLNAERRQHHKLSDHLPCGDFRPHPDVPVLDLSSVHLTMRVSQKQETERRNLSELDADLWDGPESLDHHPFQNHMHLSHEDVLATLDAGIRLAITKNPTRLARGIRLDGTESFKTLAEVAPSVWSPGYLAAMSSRSLLLPTVSHALTQVGIRNAKSVILKSKLAEVARRSGNPALSAFPDQQPLQTAQLSIGSRLFHSSQSTLFDNGAACRLKALLSSSDIALGVEHDDTLNLDLEPHIEESDDVGMLNLEDPGYASEGDLLSINGSFRSSSPNAGYDMETELAISGISDSTIIAANSPDMDEEMICT